MNIRMWMDTVEGHDLGTGILEEKLPGQAGPNNQKGWKELERQWKKMASDTQEKQEQRSEVWDVVSSGNHT